MNRLEKLRMIDADISQSIASLDKYPIRAFSKILTYLGSVYVLVPLVISSYFIFNLEIFTLLASSLIISTAISYSLKYYAKRERPSLHNSKYVNQKFSFPSSHASGSFSIATAAQIIPNTEILLALAVLISLSRVNLKYHYFSDILIGSFIGILTGTVLLI